jgi:hypothetical protein
MRIVRDGVTCRLVLLARTAGVAVVADADSAEAPMTAAVAMAMTPTTSRRTGFDRVRLMVHSFDQLQNGG